MPISDSNLEGRDLFADDSAGTDLFAGSPKVPAKRTIASNIKDFGVTALKGAVALPQAAVGIADIATGGRTGKALEGIGYKPAETQKVLDTWYSEPQQEANKYVADAEGFTDTLSRAIERPSVIGKTVIESAPQMLGGMGIARGLMKAGTAAGTKVAPYIAGAVGEGAVGAGSAASAIREETDDGLLTGKQSLSAAGSGLGTAAFGALGGKLAQKFNFGDIDTILAQGGPDSLAAGAAKKGFIRQMAEGGVSEAVFEELPQSTQEQMWQNYALDKPLTEGVGNAAAMGLLAGAVMGGAGGGYNAAMTRTVPSADPVPAPEPPQESTPLPAPTTADINTDTGELYTPDEITSFMDQQAANQATMQRDLDIERTMAAYDAEPDLVEQMAGRPGVVVDPNAGAISKALSLHPDVGQSVAPPPSNTIQKAAGLAPEQVLEMPVAEATPAGLAPEQQAAADYITAIDAGGIPLNVLKTNSIARDLGLEVNARSRPEETNQRIRDAVSRFQGADNGAGNQGAGVPAVAAQGIEGAGDQLPGSGLAAQDGADVRPVAAGGPAGIAVPGSGSVESAGTVGVADADVKVDGVFKVGDTIRVGDKVETIESIGPDGWVYTKAGSAGPASQFEHAVEKVSPSSWGGVVTDTPSPSHAENVARWNAEAGIGQPAAPVQPETKPASQPTPDTGTSVPNTGLQSIRPAVTELVKLKTLFPDTDSHFTLAKKIMDGEVDPKPLHAKMFEKAAQKRLREAAEAKTAIGKANATAAANTLQGIADTLKAHISANKTPVQAEAEVTEDVLTDAEQDAYDKAINRANKTMGEDAVNAVLDSAFRQHANDTDAMRAVTKQLNAKQLQAKLKPAKAKTSPLATTDPDEYRQAAKDELMKLLRKHGLSSNDARDLTGESAFKANQQSGGAFKGGTTLDVSVIPALVSEGYLTQQQVDEDAQGGMGAAMDLIRNAFTGSGFVGTMDQHERMAELEARAADAAAELQSKAEEQALEAILGLDLTEAEFNRLHSEIPVDEAADRAEIDRATQQEKDDAARQDAESQSDSGEAPARGAEANPQGSESSNSGQAQEGTEGQVSRRHGDRRVAEMDLETLRREILVDAMTGLGNRRAYDESAKLPVQVSIDADNLKWVNDNLGHASGDKLLEAIGRTLGDETPNAYHISGDEFVIQAATEAEARAIMDRVLDRLAGARIEVVDGNGTTVALDGVGVSFGIAENLHEAEQELAKHKAERERQGQRAARGEAPPNAAYRGRREADQADSAAAEAFALNQQTPAQAKAQEEAEQKAQAKAEREASKPTGPDVTADQVDMFNTQEGLFNSNRDAESVGAVDTAKVEWRDNKKAKSETLAYVNGEQIGGISRARSPGTSDWGWRGILSQELHFTPEKAMQAEEKAVLKHYSAVQSIKAIEQVKPNPDTLTSDEAKESPVQQPAPFTEPEQPVEANKADRDNFTLERLNRDTNEMEAVTFERGEYVRYTLAGNDVFGEIDGISHARSEFSVDGLWYPFGFAYKAEKPAAVEKPTVPLSKVIDATNKKHGADLDYADRIHTLAVQKDLFDRLYTGDVTADEFKASFNGLQNNKAGIVAELTAMTKDGLFKEFPGLAYRYKNDKKADIVEAAYRGMVTQFVLGDSLSYGMGKNAMENAVRAIVEKTTDADLAKFAEDVKKSIAERKARKEEAKAGMADPQTLEDFNSLLRARREEMGGATFVQLRMSLTPEQRAQYDILAAEKSRGERVGRRDDERTRVQAAGATTGAEIIATKHTRDGYDLFVVKAAERVERDVYNQWLSAAKKMGGWYSAFKGNWAIPGFQFKDRESAEAFQKYVSGGDTQAVQDQAKARRDAFVDDRSQTAVERLNEMADSLEDRADASLGQERKANTSKRARQAASAEAAASAEKAMAQTMRNIASAIESGKAKLLDRIRQKVQIETLREFMQSAQYEKLRALYPAYIDYERHQGEKPNSETADYVTFPSYTAFRSDLASLGRALLENDGTKKLGQRIMKVADDVSDTYLKFAKDNLDKVSSFRTKDGGRAAFPSKAMAEAAIQRSGYKGAAIVLPVKRNENVIILSPSEAIKRGVWTGDNDKRITLTEEIGAEIVEKLARANNRQTRDIAPWQFNTAHDKLKRLAGMGIETPAELRAAVREFIGLREAPKEADKIKEMERAMIGRKNDGLDFFPTPASTVDEMIEAAGIQEGMSVLEPSAGMGHIAERIREAGVDPEVVELSNERKELLEAKGFNVVGRDFMEMAEGQYDRILMNPPFGDRRDAEHVQHAYDLLKPGGRLVAIMGEGVFFGSDKKAQAFRDWLAERNGTDEKLDAGTFLDPSLPVNTAVSARMVVIDKPGPEWKPSPKDETDTGTAMFRRGISDADTVKRIASVNAIVNRIKSGWKNAPEIIVVADMQDAKVPQRVRDLDAEMKSGGAEGEPRGFISAGKVYIVAGQNKSVEDVMTTVSHEVLGHGGLRSLFGDSLKPILRQIVAMRRAEVNAKVKEYGFDPESERDLLRAAEEVLANMAETRPEMGFVKRAIAAIRQWLRDNGLNLKLTDADVIANYILPARAFIENGGKPQTMSERIAAFSYNGGVKSNQGSGDNLTDSKPLQPDSVEAITKWRAPVAAPSDDIQSGMSWLDDMYTPEQLQAQANSANRKAHVNDVLNSVKKDDSSKFMTEKDTSEIAEAAVALIDGDIFNSVFAEVIKRVVPGGERLFTPPSRSFVGDATFIDESEAQTIFSPYIDEAFKDGSLTTFLSDRAKTDWVPYAGKDGASALFPLLSQHLSRDGKLHIIRMFAKNPVKAIINIADTNAAMDEEHNAGWKLAEMTADAIDKLTFMESPKGRRSQFRVISDESPNQPQRPQGADNPDIMFSRTSIIGDAGRTYTPEQKAAMERTGSVITHKTPKQVVKSLWQDAGKKLAQGIVDQFRPVRDIDAHAYTLLRLAKGATGAFEAFMHHGKLSLNNGAYDADTSGGVLESVFYPIGKETTDFLRWVAGNRAERLMSAGKENLFSPQDIAAFKTLADGTTDFDYTLASGKVTRDRQLIYRDTLAKFNAFNKNVLDMAEQSGLIDGASRKLWENEFYVPFYRVADEDDGGVRGMNIKSGVVRQQAFQKLKGGEQQLNDLLENTLMNWAHLIDASAKNRAAAATLVAAEKLGAARLAAPGEKKTVWFMDNGKKAEYRVEDPYLLEAINGMEFAGLRGPAMDAMSTMKHVLTVSVTASPFFKVRNLIRDSVQAIATADLTYNPLGNVAAGGKSTKAGQALANFGKATVNLATLGAADLKMRNDVTQEYVSALAGGGLIRFGTMLEGSAAKRTRQLIKQGAKDAHILDSEGKVRAFYDKVLEPAIASYNELGNRGEEVNRMALYNRLIAQGQDHATASLMARDLMDFSMQGTWTSVRFLTQIVPFMNARLQGIYKLGRASQEDKARFAVVVGGVAMASLALLAAYGDDDDWKQREDWDRDNYWWFKVGGIAYRIPKPFEIGAIGTLAERSAELVFDTEMTGKRYAKASLKLVFDQLAMNPVPQLFKPVIDLYANHDSFTGRTIESMGMERLAPDYRYKQSTSMVARGVSTAGNAVTGDNFLSPVQVDHVVRAYFGWLGSFVVGGADMMIRAASDEPAKPATDYWKTATGGMASKLDGAHSRYVSQMYDQAREIEQAYGTWRNLLKTGKIEEAAEYRDDNADKLGRYKLVNVVKGASSKINERIRMIERSDMDSVDKRVAINELRKRQSDIAKRLVN